MSEPQPSPGSGEAPLGTLVGAGVGPGDPQLLTLAAVLAELEPLAELRQ